MPNIPLGPWLPDLPAYNNPGSSTMLNCVPRTVKSYGPAPSTAPVTDAIDARCQGAIYVRDSDGNVHGFAGDETKLYTNTSGGVWRDVTRLDATTSTITGISNADPGNVLDVAHGYSNGDVVFITGVAGMTEVNDQRFTVTVVDPDNYTIGVDTTAYTAYVSGGTSQLVLPYTTAADAMWQFSVFGERIIATNFTDPIQSFVMGTDTVFDDLASAAPKARYVAQVRDFLMVANTSDGTDGPVPQRVWWPAIDNPTSWPTPGTDVAAQVQSDYQNLVGPGGWNQGIVGGLSSADAVIFQERAIYRAVYIGPPAIFSFAVLAGGRGTPAPGSICQVGEQAFYLADNGFYVTDGLQSVSIGIDQVDQTFWSLVDQSKLYRITASSDPLNKLIYWAFPGPQNTDGNPNYVIVYNYALKRWSLIQQDTEVMVQALTTGYTLEELDIFGNLETLPFSLDSRAWTGGRLNLACFDQDHKLALFSGAPLAATMDSSEANLNRKALTHISRVWPIVDAQPTINLPPGAIDFDADQPPIAVTMGQRNRLADPVTWRTPTPITNTTGSAPVRSTAVYQRIRVEIAAGAIWKNAQGFEVDGVPAGNR